MKFEVNFKKIAILIFLTGINIGVSANHHYTISANQDWYTSCDYEDCTLYNFTKYKYKESSGMVGLEGYIFAIHTQRFISVQPVWDKVFFDSIFSKYRGPVFKVNNNQYYVESDSKITNDPQSIRIVVKDRQYSASKCLASVCYFENEELFQLLINGFSSSNFRASVTSGDNGHEIAILSSERFLVPYRKIEKFILKKKEDELIIDTKTSSIDLVSNNLNENNIFNLKKSDLLAQKNSLGSGFFIYSNKARFSGVKRYIIWYVNNGTVMSLNGPSITAAPNASFPKDAERELRGIPIDLWAGTGFNARSVTQIGLSQVFGDVR